MDPKAELLFTFVIEYQGNTLVEQCSGASLDQALGDWIDRTSAPVEFEEVPGLLFEYVPLASLKNVWFLSLLDDNEVLYLVNIILTA